MVHTQNIHIIFFLHHSMLSNSRERKKNYPIITGDKKKEKNSTNPSHFNLEPTQLIKHTLSINKSREVWSAIYQVWWGFVELWIWFQRLITVACDLLTDMF